MSNFSIREAQRQDIDSLVEVFSEADQIHRQAHPEIFQKPRFDNTVKAYYRSCIADPKYQILLAEHRGQVIGAVICSINITPENPILVRRKYALVENLAVSKGFRKIGAGKALMERAQEWATARGGASIDLTVWEFNKGALDFYKQLGYQIIHHKMRKKLK